MNKNHVFKREYVCRGGGGFRVSCLCQHVVLFARVTLSRVLRRTKLDDRIVLNIHVNASRLSPSP